MGSWPPAAMTKGRLVAHPDALLMKGTKRAIALVAMAFCVVALVVSLSRPVKVVATQEVVEEPVLNTISLHIAEFPEAAPLDAASTAISVLNDAGFDGAQLASELVTQGVPATFLALPAFERGELTDAQSKERHCLSQAIYFEARNQPVIGRIGVADVVLNRVADRRFPSSICGVVFQQIAEGYGCQFSFACDGSMDQPREPRAWRQAEKLADVMFRGFQPPLTRFATFYHADYVSPSWASAFQVSHVIGDHIFYHPPGAIETAALRVGIDLSALSNS